MSDHSSGGCWGLHKECFPASCGSEQKYVILLESEQKKKLVSYAQYLPMFSLFFTQYLKKLGHIQRRLYLEYF